MKRTDQQKVSALLQYHFHLFRCGINVLRISVVATTTTAITELLNKTTTMCYVVVDADNKELN